MIFSRRGLVSGDRSVRGVAASVRRAPTCSSQDGDRGGAWRRDRRGGSCRRGESTLAGPGCSRSEHPRERYRAPPSVGRAQQGRAGGGGARRAVLPCTPGAGVASPRGGRATAEPLPSPPPSAACRRCRPRWREGRGPGRSPGCPSSVDVGRPGTVGASAHTDDAWLPAGGARRAGCGGGTDMPAAAEVQHVVDTIVEATRLGTDAASAGRRGADAAAGSPAGGARRAALRRATCRAGRSTAAATSWARWR